jgi:hypothetical protein
MDVNELCAITETNSRGNSIQTPWPSNAGVHMLPNWVYLFSEEQKIMESKLFVAYHSLCFRKDRGLQICTWQLGWHFCFSVWFLWWFPFAWIEIWETTGISPFCCFR